MRVLTSEVRIAPVPEAALEQGFQAAVLAFRARAGGDLRGIHDICHCAPYRFVRCITEPLAARK